MAEEDKQVDIEISLRDTASQVLTRISKDIDKISRQLVETGRRGQDAFGKIKQGVNETGVGGKGAGEGINSLNQGLSTLAKILVSPVGLAAGIYALSKALGSFAQQRVQLSLLGEDLGITTAQISKFQQVLARKGFDEGQSKEIITNLFTQFKDVQMKDVHSEVWERINNFNDPEFASGFLKSIRSGNFYEAFELTQEKINRLRGGDARDQARARWLANVVFQTRESVFTNWSEIEKTIAKGYQVNDERMKEALRRREAVANAYQNQIKKSVDSIIKESLRLDKFLQEKLGTTPKPSEPAKPAAPKGDSILDLLLGGSKGATPPAVAPGGGRGSPFNERFGTWPGKQSSLEDETVELSARTAMRTSTRLEEESNETLEDIRDTLTDMSGSTGLTFRPGIRTGARSSGPTGPGGTTGAPSSGGAMGGSVAGVPVDAYGGFTGKELVDPMTATGLGGGLGGHSVRFGAGGHMGIDIMGKEGAGVVAPMGGRVAWVGTDGYGQQTIVIDDGKGNLVRILHIRGVKYKQGDQVNTGEKIGTIGFANDWHIHLEMWKGKVSNRGKISGALANPRAVMGWDKQNLPQAGKGRTGRGPLNVPPVPAQPPGPQSSTGGTGSQTVRASTFDDPVIALKGASPSQPGIALPSRATLGQWFWVRDENTGKEILAQQTDVGPAKWTKRGIDINAPLARKFGYGGKGQPSFPTDTNFSYRPALDSELGRNRGGGRGASRGGKVNATVDFGGMQRVREAGEIFLPTKVTSFSQDATVHRNALLPGDADWTRWTG